MKQRLARLRTHAKVNLFLRVVGRRDDDYHEIETILHGIGLGDDLDISVTDTDRVEIVMRAEDPGLVAHFPAERDNLIWRAAHRLMENGSGTGVRVVVTKRIPLGAGLGGGSANAAGALAALSELWGMGLDPTGLARVAALVGSDVPYCLSGGTALATSRGEDLTALPSPDEMWFVLGLSDPPLSTGQVYAAWDELEPRGDAATSAMTLALGEGDVTEIASLLHNDLEPAAFDLRPDLRDRKAAMAAAGVLGACMSGSGPTIYGLARDADEARRAAQEVEGAFDRVVVVRSHARCIERIE